MFINLSLPYSCPIVFIHATFCSVSFLPYEYEIQEVLWNSYKSAVIRGYRDICKYYLSLICLFKVKILQDSVGICSLVVAHARFKIKSVIIYTTTSESVKITSVFVCIPWIRLLLVCWQMVDLSVLCHLWFSWFLLKSEFCPALALWISAEMLWEQ